MKFGKLIRASVSSRMPQWEGSVLQYKRLKQAIKALVSEAGGAEPDVLVERFTTILDEEVERSTISTWTRSKRPSSSCTR